MIESIVLFTVAVVLIIWLLVNNGPNLSSELNKKFQGATATAQRVGGLESDSDEDGDLFGQRPDPLAPSNSTVPSSTASVSKPPSLGVENVRAMPDPTGVRLPGAASLPKKSNLFASDSDDEGDLFGPKPQPSGKNKGSVTKGPSTAKGSNQASQRPSKQPSQAPSGGLFSSDGDDEEDGGLFGTKSVSVKGTVENDSESEREREEPPPLPSERKVPVGGINIFGSAITSAIRRQQSSDSEQSEKDGSDWSGSRKSSKSSLKPASKPEPPVGQKAAAVKVVPPASGGGGGGLFDYDDDDDLFGGVVRKSTSIPEKTQTDSREEKPVPVAASAGASIQKGMPKRGLFSDDDDDDLFSIPGKAEKKPNIPSTVSVTEKPLAGKAVSGTSSLFSDPEEDGLFGTGASSKSQEQSKPTNPVKVPNISQKNSSLFSSPSDEDDLFSAAVSSQVSRAPPASSMEPPPLTSTTIPKTDVTNDLFGSPSSEDGLFASNASVPSKTTTSLQKDKEIVIDQEHSRHSEKKESKAQAPGTSNIFHSQSDDDDLFAVPKNTLKDTSEPKAIHNDNLISSTSKSTHNSLTPSAESDIFGSPVEDLFVAKVKSEVIEPMRKTSGSVDSQQNEVDSDCLNKALKTPVDSGQNHSTQKKQVGLFGSPEEDIFAIGKSNTRPNSVESRPSNSLKTNIFGGMSDDEDIFSTCQKPAKQKETTVTANAISDRDIKISEHNTEKQTSEPFAIDKENKVFSSNESVQPISSVTKAPVGGVALFGNDELRAKVSERKSMLNSEPEEAPKEEVKKQKSDLISNQILFDGESDDDIFSISQVSTKQATSHIPGRGSPPPLPSEIPKQSSIPDKKEVEDALVVIQNEETKQTGKLTREEEGEMRDDSSTVDDSKESKKEEKPSEEIKPKKKPPVGGVSMFGGGGLGGSELFAKVNQRRSMLGGAESDNDGESKNESASTPTHSAEILQEDKKVPKISPASKSVVSPTSPTISALPDFGVRLPEAKSGGQENSISFDDPTTTTNTLESLNKSRVRGSIKRRPPSRAHRKGPAANNPQTNTMTSSSVVQTPSNQVSFPQETNTRKLSEKVNESNPTVENQIFPSSDNEDDMFGVSEAKDINRIEKSSVKGYQASGEESRSASTPNQQAKMQAEVEDDLFSKPQGASSATKSKSLVKPFNQSQPTSLFGDDSDEDLFGVSNSRLSSLKATKSTAQQNIPKKEAKPAHSQSLFGDDEDDIFNSAGTGGKAEGSVVKKTSTSKSKTILTSTSEPFDDPLLGPRK
ncbi:WASH complex subunit 2-like isoform X3 [Penaeus japonicus]|uniref:WASH complex subunit 2-like isoform X3 n=1 Tax=Penaeus japonicus TaxID=27405 RepID=UPI001C71378A|nr:WASH complex subunit 2-like isoform X3 [Penaeus japonicus]